MIMNEMSNPQNPLDYLEESSGTRVGFRIRQIRESKGLSQAELGEAVGLNADRIQKYENGVRKPKKELLTNIASVLGVSPLALADPVTTNYVGVLFAMFEMENRYNLRIEKMGDDKNPELCLKIKPQDHLYDYMNEWYEVYSLAQAELEVASSDEERREIMKTYLNWEWNFPKGIADKSDREVQKDRIKKKIEELQKAYDKLDKNDSE